MNQPKIKEAGIVNVNFSDGVTVVTPVNLYGCAIGSNVFVGPFVDGKIVVELFSVAISLSVCK